MYDLAALIKMHDWCLQNHKAIPNKDIHIHVQKWAKCTVSATTLTHEKYFSVQRLINLNPACWSEF